MPTISDKRFVKTWMESRTYSQVATKLGLSKHTINARAVKLRARGVNLPRLSKGSKHYTVDELNKLIQSYGG